MKKEFTIAAITFFLTATPVFAHSGSNHENNYKNFFDKHADNDGDQDDSIVPTAFPTPAVQEICNTFLNWKNHGSYVSCIAHLHHIDRDNDEDDAARSNIGTHHYPTETPVPTKSPIISPTFLATPTPSETLTPTLSISVTPMETISPTPNTSPIPSISSTQAASVSPTPDNTDGDVPQPSFTNIDNTIVKIISFLSHLL